MDSLLGEFFKTTVDVHQKCLLSPILFNLFLEKIIQEILHDHHTSISMGGTPICSLPFTYNIKLVCGGSDELQDLTSRFIDSSGIWNGSKHRKSKIMANRMNKTSADIRMDGQKLEEVTSFKYLGATMYKDDTCQTESTSGLPQQWQQGQTKEDLTVQHHASALQASSSLSPSSSMAVKHGPCLLTLEKGSRLEKPSARGNFLHLLYATTWCRVRTTSLWVHRNLFWYLS